MMSSYSNDRDLKAKRRDIIGTLVVASLGGSGIVESATATSDAKQAIIRQGDSEYEISPMENGETIEDFYNYFDVESHTSTNLERSNTSILFLWEGPNGLSFVVIHDKPDDLKGGDATFTFSGLPDDGSWVVRDDNPGNDSYSEASEVEWHWNARHTDGAAFRDISGAEFTIEPHFIQGIDSWELLTGDPSDPERVELNTDQALSISVGGTPDQREFDIRRDEKYELAGQIDNLARDINERPQVANTLNGLEKSLESGDISENKAIEAIERMKLGENVTEELLADFGPETLSTEDSKTLVGNPPEASEYNTAGKIIESGINIVIEAVLSIFPFDKVIDFVPSGLVSKISTAKSKLSKFIDFAVDTLLGSYDDLARQLKRNAEDISQFLLETIRDESISKGSNLAREQTNEVAGIQDTLADLFVGIYEDEVPGVPVEDRLEEFNESFRPTDGSLSLLGDISGAENAASDGINEIKETLDSAKETIDTIGDIIDITGWLGLIAGVLLASGFFSIAGSTLNLALFIFTVAANLLGITTGALSMVEALDEHNNALDGVVNGGA